MFSGRCSAHMSMTKMEKQHLCSGTNPVGPDWNQVRDIIIGSLMMDAPVSSLYPTVGQLASAVSRIWGLSRSNNLSLQIVFSPLQNVGMDSAGQRLLPIQCYVQFHHTWQRQWRISLPLHVRLSTECQHLCKNRTLSSRESDTALDCNAQ